MASGTGREATLTAELSTALLGPPWWAQSRQHTGQRAAAAPWSTPDERLLAVQKLAAALSESEWEHPQEAKRAVDLLVAWLHQPATSAEVSAMLPALVRLMEVSDAQEELVVWCCERLAMLAGAGTERALEQELMLLCLLGTLCRTPAGCSLLLRVPAAPRLLAQCCKDEVLGERALEVLHELACTLGGEAGAELPRAPPAPAYAAALAALMAHSGADDAWILSAAHGLHTVWKLDRRAVTAVMASDVRRRLGVLTAIQHALRATASNDEPDNAAVQDVQDLVQALGGASDGRSADAAERDMLWSAVEGARAREVLPWDDNDL
jgi:hypothetical protein